MSSAILNASIMLVRFSATCNSLSLGMMMRESTFSLRRLMPSSAYVERLRPSKAKGRVTTPTVSAGAEAAGDLLPYVDLLVGITHLESLGIRVYRYELNPRQTGVEHAVHGVGSPSANADNLYDRQIISRRVQHAYFTLHYTFFEAPGSTFPGTSP